MIPQRHRIDPRKSTGRGKLIWRALAAVHHYKPLRKFAFARYR
jgi:hypothetical protein